jgi:hypothetical protein
MRDLTEAFERIAAGAQARADLSPEAVGRAADGAARRRRTAVARGALAVAGVAAAAVLAASLLGGPGHRTPPVGPDRTPTPSPSASSATGRGTPNGTWPTAITATAIPACGDAAPALQGSDDATLRLAVRPAGDGVTFLADQRAPFWIAARDDPMSTWAELHEPATVVLVARDGAHAGRVVSVSTAGPPPTGPLTPAAMPYLAPAYLAFPSCVPGLRGSSGLLPDGTYDAYAFLPLTSTFFENRWTGGADDLLLASGATPVTLAGVLPEVPQAPELPTCGRPDTGLADATPGPVVARTEAPVRPATTFSPFLSTAPSVGFAPVTWVGLTWVAVRDHVVVAEGDVPPPSTSPTLIPAGWQEAVPVPVVELGSATDCRAGKPLREGGPVELWTRPVVRADLTPTRDGDEDATVGVLSAPLWYTFDPQPVPASVPLFGGAAATTEPGPTGPTVDQIGPTTWRVGQSWDDGQAGYDALRAQLVAAGMSVAEERTVADGTAPESLSTTFTGPDGLTMRLDWSAYSGDGSLGGTWTITAP